MQKEAFPDSFPLRVLKAPAIVVAVLASGNKVVKGAPLVCDANGRLKAAAAITVTVPTGETPVTSNAAQPNLTEAGGTSPIYAELNTGLSSLRGRIVFLG